MTRPAAHLHRKPDEAVLRIARALARQAAREDHAREQAQREQHYASGDLRQVLNRPAE